MTDTTTAKPRTAKPGGGPSKTQPSMRTWLADLDAAGQLSKVSAEVDWDEEIGAIARVNLSVGGPALLFENIRGHKETRCTKFMTCGVGDRKKVALMLGLLVDTSEKDIVRHLKDTYRSPIEPVMVETGPVKDVILEGEDIDLWEFPSVKWHVSDGGRYIDTFCGVVTHDPVTGRPNIGLYRGQVLDRNKIGKLLVPTQGWGTHFGKHKDENKGMPVAIVHGWHDAMPFCAGSPFPKHICEWDMIGAIVGQPVELVDCETVPLQVPATAEIIVEGWIDPDPDTYEMEGPFADYPGYLGGKPSKKPVLKVTAVTHRKDPVMRGALEGARPGFPSEDSPLCAYSWSAIAWNMLEDAGVAGVTDVWLPPVSTGTNIVVQIRKRYRGHATQIGNALWGTAAGQWFFKNVTVVEEDIDIRDAQALDWAYAFRVNAGRGDVLIHGPTFGSVLDPSTLPVDRDIAKFGTGKWHRVLIDATRSWEHEPNPDWGGNRYPPLNKIDPKLEEKIRTRWKDYGISVDYLDDEKRELLTMKELSKRFPEV
ncbi:MAG: UbiD family decarboxylase [Fimbriimonadaceae bacterium]|nr:UbiD family decarboxylase [Alphaproteobacteria bacterium]